MNSISEVQPENAEEEITSIPSGRLTFLRVDALRNAHAGRVPPVTVTSVKPEGR